MRSRTTQLAILSIIACIVFSYVFPTIVERLLAGRIGPFWSYVVLGDIVGCAALGTLTRWKIGIALYLVLDVFEAILLQANIVGPTGMAWLADAVPTVLLCVLATMVIRVRGGWRMNSHS
jgi:hypothetical protein